MNKFCWLAVGALLGFGAGYLTWGRKEKKKDTVINTRKVETKDIRDEKTDDGEEVNNIVRNAGYVVEEYVDDEFDDEDVDDVDDYICTLDSPPDDDERAPRAFEPINDDEYYTSRVDFYKVKLHLDMPSEMLLDELGNDLSDLFARNGISLEQLYSESDGGRNAVYYRCWKMDSDYEIIVEERGESE